MENKQIINGKHLKRPKSYIMYINLSLNGNIYYTSLVLNTHFKPLNEMVCIHSRSLSCSSRE